MNESDGFIGIGTFSIITRLTRRTLRLYDKKGLLTPARREITGYRQYSYQQIRRGIQLKHLSYLGFGIREMREIIDALDGLAGAARLDTILEKRLKEVGVEICRLEKIRGSLLTRSFLEVLYLDKNEPTVKDVPDQRVVSRREKGTYQDVIPRLMGELMGVVFGPENQRAQVKCTGMPITLYHDNEYKETDADIEVALPISGSITVGPEYDVKTLEGQRVVSYIHKGPYQDVGVAYEAIREYMAKEGLKVAGVYREVYLNDPNETPEEELLTEVQVPVVVAA
uniref:HTH merR-type domain-containing protein n=1 Tax=Candidatus Methanogaster sp. ANME-2c ERB4 TaxID=2759911 RepID=A0A7G9Y0G5_9EURY|nr:hypothetical protein LLBHLIGG_00006 [Methanosarcinales archaeon ANME-2c ERB4]QNO41499.1 hypothetical protein CJIIDBMB_00001 [Methanosarcinales archaeon ANME-2c ERB4]